MNAGRAVRSFWAICVSLGNRRMRLADVSVGLAAVVCTALSELFGIYKHGCRNSICPQTTANLSTLINNPFCVRLCTGTVLGFENPAMCSKGAKLSPQVFIYCHLLQFTASQFIKINSVLSSTRRRDFPLLQTTPAYLDLML
jgi:hypothetical protein